MKYKSEIVIFFTLLTLMLGLKVMNLLQGVSFLSFCFLLILFFLSGNWIQKTIDKNQSTSKEYYVNFDWLKYICAILIIINHLRPFLNFSSVLDLTFNNMITRACVPIFFVLTGFFVGKKEKKNPDYISLYIKRTIPIYLLWSFFYLPLTFYQIFSHMSEITFFLNSYHLSVDIALQYLPIILPISIMIGLFYTGFYYHLWYFPALLCSLWILDKCKKRYSMNSILIVSFLLLLFGATETYYGLLSTEIQTLLSFYYRIFYTTRNCLFFGLFYVTMGYAMGIQKRKVSYLVPKLCISIFCFVFEAIILHDVKRLNSNILLSAVPLTYYLIHCVQYFPNTLKFNFPFRDLSKYYYLIHAFVITYFFSILGWIRSDINPYFQILLVLSGTHILSLSIMKLKKRYPKIPF